MFLKSFDKLQYFLPKTRQNLQQIALLFFLSCLLVSDIKQNRIKKEQEVVIYNNNTRGKHIIVATSALRFIEVIT